MLCKVTKSPIREHFPNGIKAADLFFVRCVRRPLKGTLQLGKDHGAQCRKKLILDPVGIARIALLFFRAAETQVERKPVSRIMP